MRIAASLSDSTRAVRTHCEKWRQSVSSIVPYSDCPHRYGCCRKLRVNDFQPDQSRRPAFHVISRFIQLSLKPYNRPRSFLFFSVFAVIDTTTNVLDASCAVILWSTPSLTYWSFLFVLNVGFDDMLDLYLTQVKIKLLLTFALALLSSSSPRTRNVRHFWSRWIFNYLITSISVAAVAVASLTKLLRFRPSYFCFCYQHHSYPLAVSVATGIVSLSKIP